MFAIDKAKEFFASSRKKRKRRLFFEQMERELLQHEGAKEILSKNSILKNTKRGKRCFILGNGPSLNSEDLRLLSGEDVFTVNQAARHPDFSILAPKFHVWADPAFFDIDTKDDADCELLSIMLAVNTPTNKPVCFFPYKKIDFVKKFELDKTLNVRYFYSTSVIADGYTDEMDWSYVIPGFHSVIMWCISLALYLGYEEIYLLGVDSTSILVNIKSAWQQNDSDDYAYELTENEKKRMFKTVTKQTLETQAHSFWQTLRQYRILSEYCTGKGVKLFNCSSKTIIDSIPKIPLYKVINISK